MTLAKQKKYVSVEEMSVAPFPRSANAVKDDLVINEFTRTWDDTCEVAQSIRDSAGPGVYQVTNLVPAQDAAAKVEYPNPTLLGREGLAITIVRLIMTRAYAMMLRRRVVNVARYMSRAVRLLLYRSWAMVVATPTLKVHSFTLNLLVLSVLAVP